MTEHQQKKKALLILLIIVYVVDLGLFSAMWATAVANFGHGFADTFSEMMGNDPVTQGLYLGWWSTFLLFQFIWIGTHFMDVSKPVIPDGYNIEETPLRHKRYIRLLEINTIAKGLFLAFFIVGSIGLIFLWIYKTTVSDQRLSHMVSATLAFGSFCVQAFALWLQRLTHRWMVLTKIDEFVLFMDGVLVISDFVLAILFVVLGMGSLEFALAITLSLYPIFQLWEFHREFTCTKSLGERLRIRSIPFERSSQETRTSFWAILTKRSNHT